MAVPPNSSDFAVVSIDLTTTILRTKDVPLSKRSESKIRESVDRYKKFLALIKKYPGVTFVPTKDIDDVWHSHMLSPRAYCLDTITYFGQILDHNAGFGSIENEKENWIHAFNMTSEIWRIEYNEEYTRRKTGKYCGGGGDGGRR